MNILLTFVVRFHPLFLGKARAWTGLSAARCYTGSPFKSDIQKYRDLERYFKRRLRAIYSKYADVPQKTTVHGRNHVYSMESEGIYRIDTKHGQSCPEEVLRLGLGSSLDGAWRLQRVRLSPGEKRLAATVKTPQREEARCVVVRLGNAPLHPPEPVLLLEDVFSFEWATDDVLFYTSQEGLQCRCVFRVELTASGPRTTLVYKEEHPDVFVEVSLSRDRKLLALNCSSKHSSEVWLVDTATPLTDPALLQPRLPGLLYHVEHSLGQLIILANTGPGQEYQVLSAPLGASSLEEWVPVCTPGPGTAVKDLEVVVDQCVLVTRELSGRLALLLVPLGHPACSRTVQLPHWVCSIETRRAGLRESGYLDLLLSSPVHPPVPYLCSPREGLLIRGEEEKDWAPRDLYHTTRLEAPSQDGTMVPVTLLHAAPLEGLKGAPLLVHVYGAYGQHLNMDFSPDKRLLLEQGWALAYCHVRGGGEHGLGWHRQGRLGGKQRGVEDLCACILLLFDQGVSSPRLCALTARSAGAILVGALCNQHPHLLRAVTLQAPFLDVLGSMQDPGLPLTVEERGEWGDPLAEPLLRHAIASYCPSHNITPQRYPSMLITAYREDSRVPVAGVHKYVDRLRTAIHTHLSYHPEPDPVPVPTVVLDLQPGGDHFGPEDQELVLAESARQLAFLHAELGLGLDHLTPRRKRRR
ncbi:prolyl endopeptidase-like [Osmerus mordax]|uniref:prolyl endopeptidase-like n=1 Tax=Osmerus mordax TaxID=8014 RepID=UPI00350FC404